MGISGSHYWSVLLNSKFSPNIPSGKRIQSPSKITNAELNSSTNIHFLCTAFCTAAPHLHALNFTYLCITQKLETPLPPAVSGWPHLEFSLVLSLPPSHHELRDTSSLRRARSGYSIFRTIPSIIPPWWSTILLPNICHQVERQGERGFCGGKAT